MSNPRYVPAYRIEINGEPLPAALRGALRSITFQTGLEGADRVELSLANERLRLLDHASFALDNRVTLSLGYEPDTLKQVFVGSIISQGASFPSDGLPMLTVSAQDRLYNLQQGTKARWFAIPIASYGNFPIPDYPGVVDMVTLGNGLIPIVDPVGAALAALVGGVQVVAALGDPNAMQRLIRKQDGESDHDFLKRIASENGWEMFIDHSAPLGGYKLRFMSPLSHLRADVTLKYGKSLIDFTPRISNVGQVISVTVRLWQSDIKMEFTITVSWDWDRQALDVMISPGVGLPGGGVATGSSSARAGLTLVDEPVTLLSAPRIILSKLLPRLNQRLTGSGSTIGDPRILAGTVLRLEGLGEQFGGLYRVTSATHTFDSSGYRTRFEVRKEIWFGSIPRPAQGAVPIRLQGHRLG